MKNFNFLLLALFSLLSISTYAQKVSASLSGIYRTKVNNIGVNIQVMVPVYKSIYIAPNISYSPEKNENYDVGMIERDTKSKYLNYGVDVHYAFYLKNVGSSFISPFVGAEGMNIWSLSNTSSMEIYPDSPSTGQGSSIKVTRFTGEAKEFYVMTNIGIAGKWFLSESFFINTQAKLGIVFGNVGSDVFVFTAGIGYVF